MYDGFVDCLTSPGSHVKAFHGSRCNISGKEMANDNASRGTDAVICWSTAAHLALQGLKVWTTIDKLPGLEISSEETFSSGCQSAPSMTAMALTDVVCAYDCFESGKAKKNAGPISAHVVNRMQ